MPTVLRVVINSEETPLEEYRDRDIVRADALVLAGLPRGMTGGRTSVAIFAELPDGRVVMLESSLRNLQVATAALTARYRSE